MKEALPLGPHQPPTSTAGEFTFTLTEGSSMQPPEVIDNSLQHSEAVEPEVLDPVDTSEPSNLDDELGLDADEIVGRQGVKAKEVMPKAESKQDVQATAPADQQIAQEPASQPQEKAPVHQTSYEARKAGRTARMVKFETDLEGNARTAAVYERKGDIVPFSDARDQPLFFQARDSLYYAPYGQQGEVVKVIRDRAKGIILNFVQIHEGPTDEFANKHRDIELGMPWKEGRYATGPVESVVIANKFPTNAGKWPMFESVDAQNPFNLLQSAYDRWWGDEFDSTDDELEEPDRIEEASETPISSDAPEAPSAAGVDPEPEPLTLMDLPALQSSYPPVINTSPASIPEQQSRLDQQPAAQQSQPEDQPQPDKVNQNTDSDPGEDEGEPMAPSFVLDLSDPNASIKQYLKAQGITKPTGRQLRFMRKELGLTEDKIVSLRGKQGGIYTSITLDIPAQLVADTAAYAPTVGDKLRAGLREVQQGAFPRKNGESVSRAVGGRLQSLRKVAAEAIFLASSDKAEMNNDWPETRIWITRGERKESIADWLEEAGYADTQHNRQLLNDYVRSARKNDQSLAAQWDRLPKGEEMMFPVPKSLRDQLES